MAKKKRNAFQDPSPDKAYGSPMTVEIDGHEWKIDRITVDDVSQTFARIRDNRIKAVLRNHRSAHRHVIAEAVAYAASIDPSEDDYWTYINTPPGIIYVLWRCFKRNHPRITEVQVAELIEKESALKEMVLSESGLIPQPKPDDPDKEGENRDPLPVFGAKAKAQAEAQSSPPAGS